MKTECILCISLLFAPGILECAAIPAGEGEYSFSLEGASLRASLDSLMRWYSVSIVYFDKDVEGKEISASCRECDLNQALGGVLQGTGLTWVRSGDQIVVMEKEQPRRSTNLIGTVADSLTGDRMAGASVVVQNTGIGGATGIDGKILLRNVPAGMQRLKISYIGYRALLIDVPIPDGGLIERTFRITPRTLRGDTVLVTALVQSQTADINQQLSSNTIKNVVSERRIHELPDFNAAEAVARLPGISLQRRTGEGYKVVIRGLSSQHNIVAINGIELRSTDKTDRSVDLSMITPQMLRTIEVYKALTPDLEGDAIGGYVNMTLREAPSGLHSDLSWQSVYTQFNKKYGSYKGIGTISNRLLDDRLGVFFLGGIEKVDRNADNYQGSYSLRGEAAAGQQFAPVFLDSMQNDRHLESRNRYYADLVVDYTLPSGKLALINFFSRMKQQYTDYATTRDVVQQVCDYTLSQGNRTVDLFTTALQGQHDLGLLSLDYSLSSSYARNNDPAIHEYVFRQESAFPSSFSSVNAQPEVVVANTDARLSDTYLYAIGERASGYKETAQRYSLNVNLPLQVWSGGIVRLRGGGMHQRTTRENDENLLSTGLSRPTDQWLRDIIRRDLPQLSIPGTSLPGGDKLYAPVFTNPDPSAWGSMLESRFGDLIWAASPAKMNMVGALLDARHDTAFDTHATWISGPVQSLADDFSYSERYSAAYLMGQLDCGTEWMFLGGVRYENDDWAFTAYQMQDQNAPLTQTYDRVTAPGNDHKLLPMVQLKYKPAGWFDVRYAYTKTLSRPDFIALTPRVFMDNRAQVVTAGNPDLIPAEAYNHDLILSFYTDEVGLLTAGGFYKTVDHLVWNTAYYLPPVAIAGFFSVPQFPGSNANTYLITWVNNPYPAYISGIEGDWQTHLWYLPFPLNGLVLEANYTHVWSTTKYPVLKVLSTYDPARRQPKTTYVDSARAGRLQDQPADIMNIALGYDYEGFSGRVSMLYAGSTLRSIGSRPETDSETSKLFRVDISVKQNLPWDHLQVYLNLNNINNSSDQAAQRTISAPTLSQFYGFAADLGIRWML